MRLALSIFAVVSWLTADITSATGVGSDSVERQDSVLHSVVGTRMLRSVTNDNENKINEEREMKDDKNYVDWTRFGIALELIETPSSEGYTVIKRSIEAAVQAYISENWTGTAPILANPITATPGVPEAGGDGGRMLLDTFQCKFSYCSVIGCSLCQHRRRLSAESTCFRRLTKLEKIIDKDLKKACKKDACGGGTVDVYAVEVPPGYELHELSPSQFC
jgi:hypothetical protein